MHTIQSIKLIDTCTQSSTVQFNCDLGVTRKTEHVEWRWNGDALDLVSVLHIVPSLQSVQTFSQLDSVQMFSAMDRRKISFAEFSAQLLLTKLSRPRSSAWNYSFNEHFIHLQLTSECLLAAILNETIAVRIGCAPIIHSIFRQEKHILHLYNIS